MSPHSSILRSPPDFGKPLPGPPPPGSSSRRIDKQGVGVNTTARESLFIRSVVCRMNWKTKPNGKVVFGLSVRFVVLILLYFLSLSVTLCFDVFFCYLFVLDGRLEGGKVRVSFLLFWVLRIRCLWLLFFPFYLIFVCYSSSPSVTNNSVDARSIITCGQFLFFFFFVVVSN